MKVTLLKIIGEPKTGEGKNGAWTRVQFLVDTKAQYNPHVAFEAMNRVAEEVLKLPIGSTFELSFNLKTNEYQGKYYTSAEAWKISEVQGSSQGGNVGDDLPF